VDEHGIRSLAAVVLDDGELDRILEQEGRVRRAQKLVRGAARGKNGS
jgi:hypothetical protein